MGRRGLLVLGAAVVITVLFVRFCVHVVPAGAPPARVAGRTVEQGLIVPVAGVPRSALTDSFTQARGAGASHEAIDIMATRATPVRAAAPGRIEKLFHSEKGGETLYIRSPGGRWIYYYAHLDGYRPGLREGQAVRQGDVVATVGATGNADPQAPHLHFEIKRMAPGERWYEGTPVNPYPLLANAGSADCPATAPHC